MRMKRTKIDKKGITLIELVIAAGICVIVMAAVYTLFTTSLKTYNAEYNGTVDQQNLRTAMMIITKDVRNPNNTVTVASNVLTVKRGANAAYSYTVSSGKLMYGTAVVAYNIASVKAGVVSGSIIQVDLTSAGGNTLSTQIQTGN